MISIKYKKLFLFTIFSTIITTILYFLFRTNDFFVKNIFSIMCFLSVISYIFYSKKIYGKIINYNSILIICLYLFSMIHQITYFFGQNSYFSYYGSFNISRYGDAYLYSLWCIDYSAQVDQSFRLG